MPSKLKRDVMVKQSPGIPMAAASPSLHLTTMHYISLHHRHIRWRRSVAPRSASRLSESGRGWVWLYFLYLHTTPVFLYEIRTVMYTKRNSCCGQKWTALDNSVLSTFHICEQPDPPCPWVIQIRVVSADAPRYRWSGREAIPELPQVHPLSGGPMPAYGRLGYRSERIHVSQGRGHCPQPVDARPPFAAGARSARTHMKVQACFTVAQVLHVRLNRRIDGRWNIMENPILTYIFVYYMHIR